MNAAAPHRERMSSVDHAWLRMDRPHNRMVIVGVMILGAPIGLGPLRRLLTERFAAHPRFHQRPVEEAGGAFWVTDPDFDIGHHAFRVALPAPAGKAELQELASQLASSPLDTGKPLWDFHLVESYQGGSALVIRIHHCYADGIALIRVLLSMADGGNHPAARKKGSGLDPADWGMDTLFPWLAPVNQASATMIRWSTVFWQRYFELALNPGKTIAYAQQFAGLASEAVKLATLPREPDSSLRGTPGSTKRAAWAEPLSLAEVKAVGKVLGCSINDVLLASAAGALRAWLQEQGDKVDDLNIRVLVPVNMREPDDTETLGNRFGLVFLDLPVGVANPLERVYTVKARMLALRQSSQPLLALGILGAVGMAPNFVQQQVLDTLSAHASAVMTNVPGPQQPLKLGGAEITLPMCWVPQSGDIGLGASILSYAGKVQFGLMADANIIPDPGAIVDRFPEEFEKLVLVTLMHSWDEAPEPAEAEAALFRWIESRSHRGTSSA